MSSIVPSPPVAPDADATTRGVVNPTAADQTLGTGTAIHRFANLVTSALATLSSVLTNLVYATGATLVLRSSLGASPSDVAVKFGTSESDVASGSKIASFVTGSGGTEVEHAYIQKGFLSLGGGASNFGKNALAVAKGIGIWEFAQGASNVTPTISIRSTTGKACALLVGSSGAGFTYDSSGAFSILADSRANIDAGNAGAGVIQLTITPTAATFYVPLQNYGRLDQGGSDSSGAPGAATINKPTGKSAIASGATSVTITNSLVAAGDQVHVTWHGDLGTQSKIPWVTTAAGSFTVNVGTAPGSAVAFCWVVSKRI